MPSLMDNPVRVEWYTPRQYGDTDRPLYWGGYSSTTEDDFQLHTGRLIAFTDKCCLVVEDGTDRLCQAEAACFHMVTP